MRRVPTFALQPIVAALLMLVLTLAGVGQGAAAASDGATSPIGGPGFGFPICHAGAGAAAEGVPKAPQPHACCEACALLAAAMLPAPPVLSGPLAAAHATVHAVVLGARPALARWRTPRQSQGPPAA